MRIKYVNPDARKLLSSIDLNWLHFAKSDPAVLVKENSLRKVWRVTTDAGVFYVKQHFRRGLQSYVKDAIVNLPALIEFQRARYAEEYGIRATRILAWGVGFDPGGARVCFSISPELADAVPFPEVFDQAVREHDSRTLNSLFRSVAMLLAESHVRGFLHRDAHADNILVTRESNEDQVDYKAWYVDLHHCEMGVDVSDEQAAVNLAELHQWFETRAPLTLRMRGLRDYLNIRFKERVDVQQRALFRAWYSQIRAYAERHASKLYGKRDRRIFGQNEFFGTARFRGGWRGRFTLQFRRRDRWPYPSQPNQSLFEWISWTSRLMPVLSDACGCEVVMQREGLRTRRWIPPSIGSELKWLILGSPARRLYRKLHRERNREHRVSPPIAYYERRWWGQPVECFIILEGDPKVRTIDHEHTIDDPKQD